MYGSMCYVFFFFQAEDGIRDLVRSRGLGDVYKRQVSFAPLRKKRGSHATQPIPALPPRRRRFGRTAPASACLLYTSDAADERSSVDLGGRRIIKKKKKKQHRGHDKGHRNKASEKWATKKNNMM